MRIGLGSEHHGFELKKNLRSFLESKNYEVIDYGVYSPEPVDYPLVCFRLGEAVAAGQVDLGVLICGTGIGVSIAANKVKGVRAVVCRSIYEAELSRCHNNANVLCIGSWLTGYELAQQMVIHWINVPFEGDRHKRRLELISQYENKGE